MRTNEEIKSRLNDLVKEFPCDGWFISERILEECGKGITQAHADLAFRVAMALKDTNIHWYIYPMPEDDVQIRFEGESQTKSVCVEIGLGVLRSFVLGEFQAGDSASIKIEHQKNNFSDKQLELFANLIGQHL